MSVAYAVWEKRTGARQKSRQGGNRRGNGGVAENNLDCGVAFSRRRTDNWLSRCPPGVAGFKPFLSSFAEGFSPTALTSQVPVFGSPPIYVLLSCASAGVLLLWCAVFSPVLPLSFSNAPSSYA
ncbi:hypothetical protein ACLOJK_029999 [Asimina triloba]